MDTRFNPEYKNSGEEISNKLKDKLREPSDDSEITQGLLVEALDNKEFTDGQRDIIERAFSGETGKENIDRLKKIAELKQIDEVRQDLDILYKEKHPGEATESQFNSERAIMKTIEAGRGITAKESVVVREEAKFVADFVKKFGIKEKPEDDVVRSTLAMNKIKAASLGRAGALGNGENRFVILRPKLFDGGTNGRLILNHEYLHMYQSKDCPKSLEEGITTLYTEAMQPTRLRKMFSGITTALSPYSLDRACCSIYRGITSEKALADVYFGGDMTALLKEYEENVGSTSSLEVQLNILEASRKLLKNRKNIIILNLLAIASMGMSFGALSLASVDSARALYKKLSSVQIENN